MPRALAVAAAVLVLAPASTAGAAGDTTPYLGVGADAAALQRAGVIGGRAGYENDTYLSTEAPMLTTWLEPTTERDFFRPKRVLPHFPGSSYRVIRGLTSGIVLGIRLMGIPSRPTVGVFRPLVPADAKLVRTGGTTHPFCRGWVYTSASLTGAIHALATAGKVKPDPAALYVHAWWTAPSAGVVGSVYVDLRTTLGTLPC